MAGIEVRVLGQFAVVLGDGSVTHRLRTRKTEMLLAYLAIHCDKAFSRESLIEAFWPDEEMAAGRQKLRLALTSIRSVLGGQLFADRQDVWIQGVEVDYLAALQELEDGEFGRSSLELLPGFDASWIVEKQIVLSQRRLDCLKEQAALAVETRSPKLSAEVLLADSGRSLLSKRVRSELVLVLEEVGDHRLLQVFHANCQNVPTVESRFEGVPTPSGMIFGRERELIEIANILLGDAEPVGMTVCALSGAGKTRLAVELCRLASIDDFDVVWLSLEDTDQIETLQTRIQRSLAPSAPVFQSKEFLEELAELPPTLLVLDNAEQFDPESLASSVDHLLSMSNSLRILVTTHGPVGFSGEKLYPLSCLAIPTIRFHELEQNPSCQLFLQRYRRHFPSLQLAETDQQHIVTICRAMAGIPLAIEIVAANCISKSLESMANDIESEIPNLRQFDPLAKATHLRLRSVIEWSYSRLSPSCQQFVGRFCALAGPQPAWLLEHLSDEPLSELIQEASEHGLITVGENEEPRRFSLVGPVRLVLSENYRDRLSETLLLLRPIFRNFCDQIETDAFARTALECSRQITNLEIWIQLSIDKGAWQDGVQLLKGLYFGRHRNGELSSALRNIKAFLDKLPPDHLFERADVLSILGHIYFFQMQLRQAEDTYREAIECAQKSGNTKVVKTSHSNLGLVSTTMGRYSDAVKLLSSALAQVTPQDPMRRQITLRANLSDALYCVGDLDQAVEQLDIALALTDDVSELNTYRGLVYHNKARIYLDDENFAACETWTQRARVIFEAENEMIRLAQLLVLEVDLLLSQNQPDAAHVLLANLVDESTVSSLKEQPPTLWLSLARFAVHLQEWSIGLIFGLHFDKYIKSNTVWLYPKEAQRTRELMEKIRQNLTPEQVCSISESMSSISGSELKLRAQKLMKRL